MAQHDRDPDAANGALSDKAATAEVKLSDEPGESAAAMCARLGLRPATLAEFEAAYGNVLPPDGGNAMADRPGASC